MPHRKLPGQFIRQWTDMHVVYLRDSQINYKWRDFIMRMSLKRGERWMNDKMKIGLLFEASDSLMRSRATENVQCTRLITSYLQMS